jgi:hypothetical protein
LRARDFVGLRSFFSAGFFLAVTLFPITFFVLPFAPLGFLYEMGSFPLVERFASPAIFANERYR